MALAAGTRIGPYEVNELLGAGGMGEVYRAHDPRLGRQVAVKVLPERFAHSADRLRRFEREARTAGALNHPNVLTVFDVGAQDGIPYLVCELLEGETLDSLLRSRRVGLRESLDVAHQVACGLTCAHDAGILHRDLKPGNLFLTRDGRVKILDFGLAKLVHPDSGSPEDRTATGGTEAGRILGTAAYMSPEQIRDEPLDGRCDIFALGAILYELISQRSAFEGSSESDIMASILRDEPPPLAAAGATVPAAVEAMVGRCLEKRREDRFGSARELGAVLQAFLESVTPGHASSDGDEGAAVDVGHPRRVSSPEATTLITPARRRIPRAPVIAVLAVPVLLGLALLARWRAAPPPAGPVSLAVMYFENLSDRTDADSIGRMLAGLVTTELAGSEGLHVISSQRLYDIARQLGKTDAGSDRSAATDVARRAGATNMVLGRVARAGSRMVATAELVEVASGRLLGSYRAEGSSAQDVFAMAERLGSDLRGSLGPPPSPDGGFPTRQLTSSAEAYRAYVRGEARLQRWQLEEAAEEFRQAVKLDPEFALAHYRLSTVPFVRSLGVTEPEAKAAAARAATLKHRLPPQYHDVVDGNNLHWMGRISESIPLLESALARDRDNKELLYVLSEGYMHSPRDTDPRRAVALMERILELDPEYHMVYNHLAVAYAILGDFDKAHEKLDGWESKEPETVLHTRSLVSAIEGRLDDALRATERLEGPIVQGWSRGFYGLAAGRWDIAREMLRKYENLEPLRACLDLNLGQFEHARSELRQYLPTRLEPDENVFGTANALVLRLLADLADLQGDHRSARREAERALEVQPEGPYVLYFAGLFAIRDGDPTAAEGHLRTLERVTKIARGPLVPQYRDALAAEVALARGRPLGARPLLEKIVGSGQLYYDFLSVGAVPGPAFREGLARTYLALGEKKNAAEAFEGLVNSGYESHTEPVRRIRALYSLGKLRLELGDREAGRESLEKFLDHWGKSDWDLPEVRDARARLAATAP